MHIQTFLCLYLTIYLSIYIFISDRRYIKSIIIDPEDKGTDVDTGLSDEVFDSCVSAEIDNMLLCIQSSMQNV